MKIVYPFFSSFLYIDNIGIIMDLSGRLILLKSSAKEEDYPTFTPEDILFLFEDITHPEGVIVNLSDPSECYVLFPSTVSIEDIFNLNEKSSWVGGSHVTDSAIDLF